MALVHDVDNDEHLFNPHASHVSTLSGLTTPTMSALVSGTIDTLDLELKSPYDDVTSQELHERDKDARDMWGKGKGATHPVFIHSSSSLPFEMDDSFPMTPSTSSSHPSSLSTPLTPSSFQPDLYTDTLPDPISPVALETTTPSPEHKPSDTECGWKGKGRELPPMLPPLNFPSTDFNPDESFWISPSISSPGPSSYASNYAQPLTYNPKSTDAYPGPKYTTIFLTPGTLESPAAPMTVASRRRSLSNLSSIPTPVSKEYSLSRIRSKPGAMDTGVPTSPQLLPDKPLEMEGALPGHTTESTATNPSRMVYTGLKVDELEATIARLSHLRCHDMPSPLGYDVHQAKHKERSQSCPIPLSALDYIPVTSTDFFRPLPLVVKNFFDDILPTELRLLVLGSLVSLYELDHRRALKDGRWSVAKASSSRGKWVGRDRGIRELVRLSRVSKSWQKLVFDGQLWVDVDLHAFPALPQSVHLRLTEIGGPFSKRLDIAGHACISAETFMEITGNLCKISMDDLSFTHLTAINLQGCISLTTRSIHHLLMCSPFLQSICLKGLSVVTNATCAIISTYCPGLISLNVGRCLNMDADGVRGLASAALSRGELLLLRELRLSGLKNIDDSMMRALGKAAPYLEVLDLSYGRQLHNSAIEAFVACDSGGTESDNPETKTVLVSSRDLGREPNDGSKMRRRLTRLRHLSFSYCILLTDETCSNLAYSVPDLEFLEMAGIGADMKDEGLIRLVKTTPKIRRLDLEDATEITDDLLAALTPPPHPDTSTPETHPGHALEHLIISYASRLTDGALLALIRGCARLKHLAADNTRIGNAVLSEFVQLCRQRKMVDAKAMMVDCRGVSDVLVKELSPSTRPRMGWRAHGARKLYYLDARDGNEDELKAGQDECDELRVVVKSFYSWQTVDMVRGVREKKRKSGSSGASNSDERGGRGMRWWSPGSGRTRSGSSSPLNMTDSNNDGCTMM